MRKNERVVVLGKKNNRSLCKLSSDDWFWFISIILVLSYECIAQNSLQNQHFDSYSTIDFKLWSFLFFKRSKSFVTCFYFWIGKLLDLKIEPFKSQQRHIQNTFKTPYRNSNSNQIVFEINHIQLDLFDNINVVLNDS